MASVAAAPRRLRVPLVLPVTARVSAPGPSPFPVAHTFLVESSSTLDLEFKSHTLAQRCLRVGLLWARVCVCVCVGGGGTVCRQCTSGADWSSGPWYVTSL
jgi:hypothetical protein